MQRLHPTAQQLREAGDRFHGSDGQPGLLEDAGGAAGGNELDAQVSQTAGKIQQPRLVEYAE